MQWPKTSHLMKCIGSHARGEQREASGSNSLICCTKRLGFPFQDKIAGKSCEPTTYHEVRPARDLLTRDDLVDAQLRHLVIVDDVISDAPAHVHDLKTRPRIQYSCRR